MFLLGELFFLPRPALGWNPDYAYGLPKQKRMCLHRESAQSLHLYPISSEEDCPAGDNRYIVVFAKEPQGAMALVPSTTSQQFYPPLTLNWPPDESKSMDRLWHFTCVQTLEQEVLGSKVQLMKYRGEITSRTSEACWEAKERALKFCQDHMEGEELLENCSLR